MTDKAKEEAIQEALSEWRRLSEISQQAWEEVHVKHLAHDESEKIAKNAEFETTGAHNRLKRLVRGMEEE